MKFKKVAAVVAGSLLVISTAQAGLIRSNVAYGMTNAQNAEAAFIAGSYAYITETFDNASSFGLANFSGQIIPGSEQNSWIDSRASYTTAAGTFRVIQGDIGAGSNEQNPNNLMIESDDTGEFGREMLGASNFWLDSNDAQSVEWSFANINATFDSLGFYLVDANDQGARLILRYFDGSSSSIAITSGLSNGNVAYVSLVADSSLVNATITFDNNGDTNRETNDGWAINDVTVAKVPEPTTLAFLGLGLLGLFAARKR